jgi:hypothetical protein
LHSFLLRQKRRLSVACALRYGIQLSTFIAQLHAAAWAWEDCKPANLIVTNRGELRPLDFEGACPIDRPDPLPWMTPAFTHSSESGGTRERSAIRDDLFAFGTVLHLLLTGVMPGYDPGPLTIQKLRRNTPVEVCELLSELLDPCASRQTDAASVAGRLRAAWRRIAPGIRRPGLWGRAASRQDLGRVSLRRSSRDANRASV